MRLTRIVQLVCGSALVFIVLAGASGEHDYSIKPVPFTAVHLNDVFWAPRIETNRSVTIPYAFQKCEDTSRVANFVHAAEALRGQISDADRTKGRIPARPLEWSGGD